MYESRWIGELGYSWRSVDKTCETDVTFYPISLIHSYRSIFLVRESFITLKLTFLEREQHLFELRTCKAVQYPTQSFDQ